jgi:hypothetical protein
MTRQQKPAHKNTMNPNPTTPSQTNALDGPDTPVSAPAPAKEAFTAKGDRHPAVNLVYPEAAFLHAGRGGRLIDVTKPPFYAKGDGQTDDTGALIAAMDYIQRLRCEGSCSYDRTQAMYILYLPNGTYRVSNTVHRSLPVRVGNCIWENHKQYWVMDDKELENLARFPHGKWSNEVNNTIVILGQSRTGTVIRLDDNCPGFGAGQSKPVVAYFRLRCGSNVNMDNVLENVTIDTGKGNPGAVGVCWNASNTGAIRNTTIQSGDGEGVAGLLCDVRNAHGLIENLTVSGFNEGLVLTAGSATTVTLEHATFLSQQTQALRVAGNLGISYLSARKVLVENTPLAVKLENHALAVLLDSTFRCTAKTGPAITVTNSHLLARNLTTAGCVAAIIQDEKPVATTPTVQEYVSGPVVSAAAPGKTPTFAGLPVEETPLVLPANTVENWANVDDFGAVGDGVTDDTAAIQRAMNSGKPALIFPRATYTINGTVRIPKAVSKLSFLYGSTLRAIPGEGAMFCVAETSTEPLLIEQNINFGGILLDHEADRPVVLADSSTYYPFQPDQLSDSDEAPKVFMPRKHVVHQLKTNCWRLYRNTTPNSVPKRIFVNNCFGFAPGGPEAMHAVENVRVWCRCVNTEHNEVDFAFRKSRVWILGFKTELNGTHFHVADDSRLEVLGGIYYQNGPDGKAPIVIARDSDIRVTMSACGGGVVADIIVENQRAEYTTTLDRDRFPFSETPTMPVIPLLVN